MTMTQLVSLTEDELCLLLYIVNEKFPTKLSYPVDRDMLLSYNIHYMVRHLQQVANDIKEEHRPIMEGLFFKITHELEHIITLNENPPITETSTPNVQS